MITDSMIVGLTQFDGRRYLAMPRNAAGALLRTLDHSVRVTLDLLPTGQSIMMIYPKVEGGKGGFGKLLRSQKGKKTDNYDSCRDLEGRRIRVVKRDERLEELENKKVEPKSESAAEKVAAPAASVTLDEKYTRKLIEIRKEKESAVAEGIKAALVSQAEPKVEPPGKKLKSIKLFDDEDSD